LPPDAAHSLSLERASVIDDDMCTEAGTKRDGGAACGEYVIDGALDCDLADMCYERKLALIDAFVDDMVRRGKFYTDPAAATPGARFYKLDFVRDLQRWLLTNELLTLGQRRGVDNIIRGFYIENWLVRVRAGAKRRRVSREATADDA
jgi:hypothetical protein